MVPRLILAGAPLHPAVIAALRAAAADAGSRPIDTRDLLVALMHADQSGEWSRIWLHTGDIDAIAGTVAVDPEPASSAVWEGVPATDTCAIALDVSGRLAFRYNLWPIPVGLIAQAWIGRMLNRDHDSAAPPSTTTSATATAVPLQVGTAAPDGSRLDIHVPAGTELAEAQWPDGCALLTDVELRAVLPQAIGFTRDPRALQLIGLDLTNGPVDMRKGYIPRAGCNFGFQLPPPLQPNSMSTGETTSVTVMMLGIVDASLTDELYEKDREIFVDRVMTDIGDAWGADACYTWHSRGDNTGADSRVVCRKGQYYFDLGLDAFTLSKFQGGATNFARILAELVKTISSRLNCAGVGSTGADSALPQIVATFAAEAS
ncbi:hypothetical protein [Nocardia sp. CDC160]|uniref:hypothetical protein n=1 Tax=Nocardia sp. CDC160 TaxID=3112166 RepID=UPI002DBB4A04|nr:hypothetical protein [Nocardia sp. CDC160]MEC3919415.1 hypothetical protein [Nocardia sp. CDC160]